MKPWLRSLAVLLAALTALTGSLVAAGTSTAAAPAAPTADAVQLRVLHYNIRYGSRGLDDVARTIARTGADVVMLNEVDDRWRTGGVHQARYLARRLGMTSVFDGNIRTPRYTRGNAVLSRFPIGDVRRYDLFVPPGTRPRGLMRARVAVRGVRIDVWSTHLNVGRGTVRQARDVAARIGDPDCATVLGADINAGPGSPEDQVLHEHLRDVWRDAGSPRATTNGSQTSRIDFLYVDRVVPRAAWVTPLGDSDHRGVVGVLRVGRPQSC